MNKFEIKLAMLLYPDAIKKSKIKSSSRYLSIYKSIAIDNIKTKFVECMLCHQILKLNRFSWRGVIYHFRNHYVNNTEANEGTICFKNN